MCVIQLNLIMLLLSCAFLALSHSLKIFMIELPQWKNESQLEHSGAPISDITDSDYGLDQLFPQLLRSSQYTTKDPFEADFFYVDAWIFWPHARIDIREVVRALQAKGPWWDRKGGADFIFKISADLARCNGYHHMEVEKAIFLHHFGGSIHGTEFFGGLRSVVDRNGAELDRLLIMSDRLAAFNGGGAKPYGANFNICHRSFQDIVVPMGLFERTPRFDCHHCHYRGKPNAVLDATFDRPSPSLPLASRWIKLLFAGPEIRERPEYSLGTRQTVLSLFKHREHELNFSLTSGHSGDFFGNMKRSIFCLAAAGFGWGARFKIGLVRGCIPLIMQDGVKVEFEENLPIYEYSVRIPLSFAYALPELIQALIDTGRVAKMQKNLDCAWRLHTWRQPDGRAMEVVACVLRRRSRGLDGSVHVVDFNSCSMTCIQGEEPLLLST